MCSSTVSSLLLTRSDDIFLLGSAAVGAALSNSADPGLGVTVD